MSKTVGTALAAGWVVVAVVMAVATGVSLWRGNLFDGVVAAILCPAHLWIAYHLWRGQ